MEITITINGKPVQATVDDAVIREAMGEKKPEKKTGYERESKLNDYYYLSSLCGVDSDVESNVAVDDRRFNVGNYFTCRKVAESNARADALMRQLRRFAAEHGGCLCPKSRGMWTEAYVIRYDGNLSASVVYSFWDTTWGVLFVSKKSCEEAIEDFRDELMWYFTEYDPMPEGWWDE
jgi:hypothetical protein